MSQSLNFRRSPVAAAVCAALQAATAHAGCERTPGSQLPCVAVSGTREAESYKAERVSSSKFT